MLTTASYDARKYGVRSGMPGELHQLLTAIWCIIRSHKVSLQKNYALTSSSYQTISRGILKCRTLSCPYSDDTIPTCRPLDVMRVTSSKHTWSLSCGVTTVLASITPYCQKHNLSAEDCVQEMRRVVFEETKLTVSAGIAPNKVPFPLGCSNGNLFTLSRCSQR